jgi:hypothetical protein
MPAPEAKEKYRGGGNMKILILGHRKVIEESAFSHVLAKGMTTTLPTSLGKDVLAQDLLWDIIFITECDEWKELFEKALVHGRIVFVIGDKSCAGCLYDNSQIFYDNEDFVRYSLRYAANLEIPMDISHEV